MRSRSLDAAPDVDRIVLLLADGESPSHTVLVASLRLNLATATKIIDRLVSDNFVHRKPHASDRRRIPIHLTEDGEQLARQIGDAFAQFMYQLA